MSFDFYAELGSSQVCPADSCLPYGLAAGFVDGCSVVFHEAEIRRAQAETQEHVSSDGNRRNKPKGRRKKAEQEKNQARRCYMKHAARGTFTLPSAIALDPWPSHLLRHWLGLEVHFQLLTSCYSKDDRVFHVLDNPVRKDRVFGVPFMAATSWKGMLRWACRMQAGLREHLEEDKKFEAWTDPHWILHLFGNEKGEELDFHQGALVFYPTWFDKIGFEVINPHSREWRAGTQPIYYEVVPPGASGKFRLLYAPWPGMKPAANPKDFLQALLEAMESLLIQYGISAKRTVGWGTAKITHWQAWRKGKQSMTGTNKDDLWQKIEGWFQGEAP